jgi:hypothetical protein
MAEPGLVMFWFGRDLFYVLLGFMSVRNLNGRQPGCKAMQLQVCGLHRTFYANAAFFAEPARRLVNELPSPVRWLAIDATAITGLDFSAGRAVAELQQDLAQPVLPLPYSRFRKNTTYIWIGLGFLT